MGPLAKRGAQGGPVNYFVTTSNLLSADYGVLPFHGSSNLSIPVYSIIVRAEFNSDNIPSCRNLHAFQPRTLHNRSNRSFRI